MNDSSLRHKLNRVRVPERSDDYWDDFPARVRVQLRHNPVEAATPNVWRPRLACAGGVALALALVFCCIQFQPLQAASDAITRHENHLHRQWAKLNAGLRVLASDTHGMGYLVGEEN